MTESRGTQPPVSQPPQPADAEAVIAALITVLRITRNLEWVAAGISPQQYRILRLIAGGGERSARLAEKLGVSRPTLTATADSLVAAGLAVREPEPGDRRVVRLTVTEAGRAATRQADAAYLQWFSDVLDDTGHRAEILSSLADLDGALTRRREARRERRARETGGRGQGRPAAAPPASSPPSADASSAGGARASAAQQ